MKKSDVIKLFGGTPATCAAAMDTTRQALEHWPENMKQWQCDYVYGLACRLGMGRKIKKLAGY
jgi:hypothetical protein